MKKIDNDGIFTNDYKTFTIPSGVKFLGYSDKKLSNHFQVVECKNDGGRVKLSEEWRDIDGFFSLNKDESEDMKSNVKILLKNFLKEVAAIDISAIEGEKKKLDVLAKLLMYCSGYKRIIFLK